MWVQLKIFHFPAWLNKYNLKWILNSNIIITVSTVEYLTIIPTKTLPSRAPSLYGNNCESGADLYGPICYKASWKKLVVKLYFKSILFLLSEQLQDWAWKL